MSKVPGYINTPITFLEAEAPLKVTVYVYMPLNQKLVLVKKRGDVLPLTDMMNLVKTPARVFTPEPEYQQVLSAVSNMISSGVTASGPSPEVKAFAESTMKKMTTEGKGSVEVSQSLLNETSKIVDQVITNFKTENSHKAYYDFLLGLNKDDQPLSRHQKQVCAMAALVQLSLEGTTPDTISELALAANAHDLCLGDGPPAVMKRHLEGQEVLSQTLSPQYYQQMLQGVKDHIDLVLKKLITTEPTTPEGAKKIIYHHHENFDGTGLLGLTGDKIYRPAALLRIIDDIVCLINAPAAPKSLDAAFTQIEEINNSGYLRLYHPDILKLLKAKMFT